jgi:hypothetical protein
VRGPDARRAALVLAACAGLAGSAAVAAVPEPGSVVFVTDELRLGLYATEETSDRARRTLLSGTRLTVLERSLRSIRVRTDDGAEGWVKAAYVVETEPARARLERTEEAHAVAVASLAERDTELAKTREQVAALSGSLAALESRHENLPALEAENATLKERLARHATRQRVWLAVAAVLGLVLGAAIGWWWLDRRVRRQFGGVRIY